MRARTRKRFFCHCGSEMERRSRQCIRCARLENSVERFCARCQGSFRCAKSRLSGKSNARAKFCSIRCYRRHQRRHPRRSKLRGPGWLRARREALRRAPFCAMCGTLRRLQVHHVIPYRLTRDNSQPNLIPLCGRHHKIVENLFVSAEEADASIPGLSAFWQAELRTMQACTWLRLSEAIRAVTA